MTIAVTLVHLELTSGLLETRLGSGADPRPRRFEIAFVRELAPAAPPPAAPAPQPRPVAAVAPAPAASAPVEARPELLAEAPARPEPQASAPAPAAPAPVAEAAADVAAPAAAASAPAAFEWPPSTRLSYLLTGNYRGPVEGQAQVEWLRSGSRYQVHLDLSVGPSFAPLISRRISSDGLITEQGLEPRRYDEETKVALRSPRRLSIVLDADRVQLPGGTAVPRPPGLQDTASQFVQLTWMFTMQPALLQRGSSIELPLALPRHVQNWTYEVMDSETLDTPFGPLAAVHVKPRREARPGGDLTAEFWVAPSLQYLPVRIVIRQDEQTWVDLMIDRLPAQAAEPGRR